MASSNHTASLLADLPQVLPRQDRALSWACSAIFHTLALAVASIAAMSFQEAPPAQVPIARLEILLTDLQQKAEQETALDSQDRTDPPAPYETAAHTEDSSPVVPSPSPSIVEQTAQRTAAKPPPPHKTDRSTTTSDQVPAESSESIEPLGEYAASVTEPDQPTSPSPIEAVKQAELTASTSSHPEPIATQHDDHVEAAPQPEASASSPTDPGPMIESQSDSSGSPTSPSAEIVAMHHPVVTQSISAKSQYAWLMELLRHRIVNLQAYPHQARIQGWEGIVVVKTTINSDGNLINAVVTKSSGYGALDEDAVKLMHRVCPIHLTQDLGKAKIAVMIPIRYRLDGFE